MRRLNSEAFLSNQSLQIGGVSRLSWGSIFGMVKSGGFYSFRSFKFRVVTSEAFSLIGGFKSVAFYIIRRFNPLGG